MFISIHHQIHDQEQFRRNVNAMASPPPQLLRHQFLAATDLTEATCLWEAPAIEPLRSYIEGSVEPASTQTYFEVNAARAVGLPASQLSRNNKRSEI